MSENGEHENEQYEGNERSDLNETRGNNKGVNKKK